MGVLNVTPDSFTGDGLLRTQIALSDRLTALQVSGADVIDIGGESTRPGFIPVAVEEELRRVLPAVQAATSAGLLVSIDTRKASVAREAVAAGAHIVNDVSGLSDPEMVDVVAETGVSLVVVHARPVDADRDVLSTVLRDLSDTIDGVIRAGVSHDHVIIDPGFGFGKTWQQNLVLMRDLARLRELGLPVLIGPSRKGTISRVLGVVVDDRLEGTLALVTLCIAAGVDMVRVHDVTQVRRAAIMTDALVRDP
jgi:dihydropteroate synthase